MHHKNTVTPPNARAIIWCAVSTRQQAGDEHFSMDDQEKWGLEMCEQNGWRVVDILRVPGHSRNYRDIHTLATDARAKGIIAFDRLLTHLRDKDFDVIVLRDINRMARSATLVHWMLESIIDDCGAVVYSRHDGWITMDNMDGFAAIKGYSTAKEIRWIKDAAKRGKKKLLERGLPIGPWLSPSHARVRDPITGKDVALVVNEPMRPLYEAIAELVLEGIGWVAMGYHLYRRFGFLNKINKPYAADVLYNMMYNPMLWGHMATRHSHKQKGMWIFEPNHEIPEGVDIAYNVIPPFFTGRMATLIQAELIRRWDIVGRAKPHNTFKYTGTCICADCGGSMTVVSKYGSQTGVRCQKRYYKDPITNLRLCTNSRLLPNKKLYEFWQMVFKVLLSGEDLDEFVKPHPAPSAQINTDLQSQLQSLQTRLETLIDEQSLAPLSTQPVYRKKIDELGKLIDDLSKVYHTHKQTTEAYLRQKELQRQAIEEVNAYGDTEFWSMSDVKINQFLKRILGSRKLVVLNGEIIGIMDVA